MNHRTMMKLDDPFLQRFNRNGINSVLIIIMLLAVRLLCPSPCSQTNTRIYFRSVRMGDGGVFNFHRYAISLMSSTCDLLIIIMVVVISCFPHFSFFSSQRAQRPMRISNDADRSLRSRGFRTCSIRRLDKNE